MKKIFVVNLIFACSGLFYTIYGSSQTEYGRFQTAAAIRASGNENINETLMEVSHAMYSLSGNQTNAEVCFSVVILLSLVALFRLRRQNSN